MSRCYTLSQCAASFICYSINVSSSQVPFQARNCNFNLEIEKHVFDQDYMLSPESHKTSVIVNNFRPSLLLRCVLNWHRILNGYYLDRSLSLSLAKGFSLLDKFFDWRSLWKRVHSEVNSVTRTALYRVSLKLSSGYCEIRCKRRTKVEGKEYRGTYSPP